MRREIHEKIKNDLPAQVNLGEMKITDAELREILDTMTTERPEVERVFLNNNQIGDKGAAIIADHFAKLPKLAFIDLQFNQIDQSGMLALFTLKHPHTQLALHGNKISNVSVIEAIKEKASTAKHENKAFKR